MMPRRTEAGEQRAVLEWADRLTDRHPELAYLHHSPNGGARHRAVAAQLRAAGVRRGFPDLVLLTPRYEEACGGWWHGLLVELKVPGGRVRLDQARWLAYLASQRYLTAICWSADAAIAALTRYLSLPKGGIS